MRKGTWFWLILGGGVLSAWLYWTPPGLLGKADAIAYAVCSRTPGHSPFLGARQMPLCFRDTGMHLGALLTLAFLAWRDPRRRGGFPKGLTAVVLGALALAFVVDGGNSFFYDLAGAALYTPHNALRLLTGLGMGIGIGAMVFAAFHQTAWQTWEDAPALTSKRLAVLLLTAGAAALMVLSNNPLLLYPIALLTTGDVVLLLTLIYSLLALIITHKENTASQWKDLGGALLTGWCITWLQISAFDAFRFALTHTWGGFPHP